MTAFFDAAVVLVAAALFAIAVGGLLAAAPPALGLTVPVVEPLTATFPFVLDAAELAAAVFFPPAAFETSPSFFAPTARVGLVTTVPLVDVLLCSED